MFIECACNVLSARYLKKNVLNIQMKMISNETNCISSAYKTLHFEVKNNLKLDDTLSSFYW